MYDLLLSPVHGYFFSSPIYLVAIAVAIWQVLLNRDKWVLCFVTVLTLKIIAESLSVNSGVNLGARSHLIDLPLLLYVLASRWERFDTTFKVFIVGAAFWTCSVVAIYKSGFRLFSFQTFYSSYLFEAETFFDFIRGINTDIFIYFLGAFVIFIFFLLAWFLKRSCFGFFTFVYMAVILNSGIRFYPNVTDSRLVAFNKKEGWFIKEEVSNFVERLDYYLYRDEYLKFNKTLGDFDKYLKTAEEQIVLGNIDSYWKIYSFYKTKNRQN